MKFCPKCKKQVLTYESDVVPLDELQTSFAICISCTICDKLIHYQHINHEENRTSTNSEATQHTSIRIQLFESDLSQNERRKSTTLFTDRNVG